MYVTQGDILNSTHAISTAEMFREDFRLRKLHIIQQSEGEECKGNKSRWNRAF